METHFEWRDEFNIGVDVIDREHQRLFKIINKIVTLRLPGGGEGQPVGLSGGRQVLQGPHREALRG